MVCTTMQRKTLQHLINNRECVQVSLRDLYCINLKQNIAFNNVSSMFKEVFEDK